MVSKVEQRNVVDHEWLKGIPKDDNHLVKNIPLATWYFLDTAPHQRTGIFSGF